MPAGVPRRSPERTRRTTLDLHFSFDRACEVTVLPHDLAVLMVGVAQRQAASATALAQASLYRPDPALFRPVHGAFNGPMAATCRRWREE